MTELQNIATYCCNGVAVNDECPFNRECSMTTHFKDKVKCYFFFKFHIVFQH